MSKGNVYTVYGLRTSKYMKIGYTSNFTRRRSELQVGNPERLSTMFRLQCRSQAEAQAVERALHTRCHARKCRGEWFKIRGAAKSLLGYLRKAKENLIDTSMIGITARGGIRWNLRRAVGVVWTVRLLEVQ